MASPRYGRAWLLLARAHSNTGDYANALPAWEQALALRQGLPSSAAYNIAVCHARLGHKRALRIGDDDSAAMLTVERAGDKQETIRVASSKEDVEIWNTLPAPATWKVLPPFDPQLEVEPRFADLRANRDRALEIALEVNAVPKR